MQREATTTSSAKLLESTGYDLYWNLTTFFFPENDSFFFDYVSINKERAIQGRKRKTKAKTVYLLNKLHMESIVTAQSQNLAIFDT